MEIMHSVNGIGECLLLLMTKAALMLSVTFQWHSSNVINTSDVLL